MNPEQEYAYSDIISGKNVFITGGGGVGKSYLIKFFYDKYKSGTFITSTTGISALNIGGQTIHSLLGIGLGNETVENLVKKIKRSKKVKLWREIKTLIIDEISMLDPVLFDKLEEMARIVRKNETPFGGIQLVITGDFCQLPCVNSDKFCFEAVSWDRCIEKTHYLKQIVRQSDEDFIRALENIRIGVIENDTKKALESRIVEFDEKNEIKPTMLYPYNAQVDLINHKELIKLVSVTKKSETYTLEKTISPGYFGSVIIPSNLPETVTLAIGAQVMLTINLDLVNGLVNGSRGVVISFTETRLPVVKFLSGTYTVNYYTNTYEEKQKILYTYTQIPLKLAWAISIHKSQGMTLDLVKTDLTRVFEYGQGYVCLSRVKNLEGLYLSGINYQKIRCHPKASKYYQDLEKKK
jgi:ATP-dependent DNA helicase PIF1